MTEGWVASCNLWLVMVVFSYHHDFYVSQMGKNWWFGSRWFPGNPCYLRDFLISSMVGYGAFRLGIPSKYTSFAPG